MTGKHSTFDVAARVIEDSVAVQTIQSAWFAIENAAVSSRVVAHLLRATSAARQTPRWLRVRSAAIAIAVACVTHVVLLQWMPRRLAPAVPVAWWIAAALFAAIVAAAAAPLTNAWRQRGD